MPIWVKVLFTVATVAIAVALYFVEPVKDNTRFRGVHVPSYGGEEFWYFLFKPDGQLRRYTKLALVSLWGIALIVMWSVL